MDLSLPVAKRTRLQEALMFRRLYEERKRNAGVSTSGSVVGESGSDKSDKPGAESACGGEEEVEGRGNVDFLGCGGQSEEGVVFLGEVMDNSGGQISGGRISEELGTSKNGDSLNDVVPISDDSGAPSEYEDDEFDESEFSSYDDSDDSDYVVKRPRVCSVQSSSFDRDEEEEEGDGSNVPKEESVSKAESVKGKGKGKGKGKEKEKVRVGDGRNVVEEGSVEGKGEESGTFTNPFYVDQDVEGKGEAEEEEKEEDEKVDEARREVDMAEGNANMDVHNDGECAQKNGGKDEGELGKQTKRKRVRAPKQFDALKILIDSILEKEDGFLENLISSRHLDSNEGREPMSTELPLKFKFGEEQTIPVEKSGYEFEMDQLWSELDFALRSAEMSFRESDMVDKDDLKSSEVEIDQAVLCGEGSHHLVLDEQIGIRCRFCSVVHLEIKHILPSFVRSPWGKSEKRSAEQADGNSIFDELQFKNPASSSHSGDCSVHPGGTVWDIIPGIKSSMYKHQCEGFEFIWSNVAGGIYLDELGKSSCSDGGSGCIISHAPGTGKTRLTIVFLQTYMKLYATCRPVIIAPRSMLLTWEEEFKKWNFDIPFHNLNNQDFSGKENRAAVNLLMRCRHWEKNAKNSRMVKLYSWAKDTSILGISYPLFEKLAGERAFSGRRNERTNVQREQVRRILLELPGLLVLDEGHTPRNEQSLIWKALSKIETEKRIILSGTPFQNNFKELFNTLCLVRPKFADRMASEQCGGFKRKRGRKSGAARGKWAYLTSSIGKAASDNIEELRAMIEPFVHIHKGTILQENLPGLRDSVVVLHPSDLQKMVLKGIDRRKNPLEQGYLVSLVSVHPSLLPSEERKQYDQKKLEKLKLNLDVGIKSKFLMEFMRLTETMNEKVLVFSQYLDPLTYLMDQLKSQFHWSIGKEVLYMDGQHDVKHRQSSINIFNDQRSEARVLFASTRACSEGISLVGASRVILLDVVWNPSVERQAISRAYRLGQKKLVYIYHLITSGTIEEEKYCRQSEKERISELVFSSKDRTTAGNKISSSVSEDKILEEMVQHDKLKYMFDKIIYQPKEKNLIETFGLVDPETTYQH